MTTDIADAEATALAYLEALYVGDADGLALLFIPEASLFARSAEGAVAILPRDRWLDIVRGRQSARDAGHPRTNRVFSVEVVGATALARVTASHPPNRFEDFLCMVRTDAGWRIVAKTYAPSPA